MKRSTSSPFEPVIISRLQRTTAAQLARERAQQLWRQRALRLLLHAIVVAIGLRILAIAVQPCLAAYRSSRDIEVLGAQLQREEKRHHRLLAQKQFLLSDHGVEEEARRFGWTKAGEIPLQIITPEPAPAGQPAVDQRAPADRAKTGVLPSRISGSERLRLWLSRWLEGRVN
jgi:hypothetical protein